MLDLTTGLLHGLLAAAALLAAIPAVLLLAQVLASLWPGVARAVTPAGPRPRIAIVMPAHNESSGLLPALAAAQAQLLRADRLLVVADNCSDDTAAVARGANAEVTERFNTALRGKGHALDHGVRHLAADPPDVVIVLDADCIAQAGSLERIACLSHATGRPVQATYLMTAPNDSLKARIAEFAMRVKNRVRPRGMHRMGLDCGLYGTGMAFPWPVAATAPLASSHLAEDMQLGVQLARRGTPPLFCEEAMVSSTFAGTREGEQSQRTRWEHGHLSLLLGEGPRLVAGAVFAGRMRFLMLVLDMLVPPLALLSMATLVVCAIATLAAWAMGWYLPLALALLALAALAASILLARARYASDLVSLRELLGAPLYMLAKIPMYARFLVKRQVDWVRTKRDSR
ncbi:glycosyl transferase [Pseudorhodoferax aquiterrae]|uniref:Glycosyl transferase n=1 Tax=Pseudorhodoferax aquiterrae TaxID=747304 RepID=A0ABQ3G1J7_9BURK|nr:glycosyltransferase family 2 protein [Pseudorhodoferax aquiterrae]GHC79676.1 glycosyl transferase [Pseudorhodoferax aquiterrae]